MKPNSISPGPWSARLTHIRALHFVTTLALTLLCRTSVATNPQMCVPSVTGGPVQTSPGHFDWGRNPPCIPATSTNSCSGTNQSTSVQSPVLDTGWFGAARQSYGLTGAMGQPQWDGAVQTIQQGSKLYVSFQMQDDTVDDQYTAVVIGFDNNPNSPHLYTWIVINGPFLQNNSHNPQSLDNANAISVWQSSAIGSLPNGGLLSFPWIHAWASSDGAAAPTNWYVVVSIDIADASGPLLPTSGQFHIFLDEIKSHTGSTDMQYAFPPGAQLTNATSAPSSDPTWGAATLATSDPACTGIQFATNGGDIFNTVKNTSGTPNPHVSPYISTDSNQSNNFSVIVHNSLPAASAGDVTSNVQATFEIANFGLPAPVDWMMIGTNACAVSNQQSQNLPECAGIPSNDPNDSVANNPTSAVDILKADPGGAAGTCANAGGGFDTQNFGCRTITAGPWTLGTDNTKYYNAHSHQCVRVVLDSLAPGGATFLNNTGFQNFNFANHASKFVSDAAYISGKYPPVKNNQQAFDLRVSLTKLSPGYQLMAGEMVSAHNADKSTNSTVTKEPGGGDRITSAVWLIVQGCRHTGQFVTIQPRGSRKQQPPPKTFENCESVGAYGYEISHTGDVAIDTWNYKLLDGFGNELPFANGVYQLTVKQDDVAKVLTQVEPQVPGSSGVGKFAIFLDVGGNVPQGTFSNSYKAGVSLNGGLEYMLYPRFSVEGIFGYHRFPGKTGPSLNGYQFSVDGKVYLTTTNIRPFVNAGVGGYVFTPGGTGYFGGNAGGGVLYILNAHWGLQGSYNFHAVKNSGVKFSTLQGGIRYAF